MSGFPPSLAAAALAVMLGASPAPVTWTHAASIPGVFDVTGPRSDGRLVVAANGLFLLDPAGGGLQRFAGDYAPAAGAEAYVARSTGATLPGCAFARDDLFVLQLTPAGGVLRIDAAGVVHPFAAVDGVDSLNGIAFDGQGSFGHRLLVLGQHAGHATLAAIDCTGAVTVLTSDAPVAEGGIAVAPAGFGPFAGDVIVPDELSGTVYAISPSGAVRVVARPDLATGGDIGVEGLGFIPDQPVAGVTAYFADRGTKGSPHPGTDSLLAVSGQELARAGAQPGDLLAATEGGAGMVGIRCARGAPASTACRWYPIIADNSVSHGEGHVVVLAGRPGRPFTSPPAAVVSAATPFPTTLVAGAVAAVLVVLAGVAALLWRRRA